MSETVMILRRYLRCGRELLLRLIPAMLGAVPGDGEDEGPLAGLAAGDLHAVMQERTSSHLFEVRIVHFTVARTAAGKSSCVPTPGLQQDCLFIRLERPLVLSIDGAASL